MKRQNDFALLGKIKILEKFYKNKRINFFELFYSVYSVYNWGLSLKNVLRKNKAFRIEKIFYKEIIKYRRKNLLSLIILLLFLKNIFSKNRSFYYQALKIKLFKS